MLFEHIHTGEIVEVIGLYAMQNGTLRAKCLCDARLHPENEHNVSPTTVAMTIGYQCLRPIETPNWDEVKQNYSDDKYSELLESRRSSFRTNVNNSSKKIYSTEFKNCIDNGMPEDAAKIIAESKQKEYVEKRLERIADDNGTKRDTTW